jgi:hypothetical protein
MANHLEDVLRDLAKRGEISHISLVPSQNGKLWRASFAMSSRFGVSFGEDADPAKAIILACTSAKMKPRPAERRPTSIDLEAEHVDPYGDLM